MNRQDHITGPAFLLVIGRTAGLLATFAIGPVLVRLFSVEEIATYKAFFLVYATLYGLAQLGMAESLYYFVPGASKKVGRYIFNAAMTLLSAGLVCLAGLWLFRTAIADFFSNPGLAEIVVWLGLFLTLTLVGTVLEITMISRKQHMSAAITYALSDLVRTALFILPALLLASLRAVFIGAVIFAGVRLGTMLVLVWRQYGREFRPDVALWRSQLAYALPFALAVGVEVILVSYHQYVVAGTFDRATFAIYATACMSIPLVDLVMTSTTSVMMVKMAEHRDDPHESLWLFHDTVSRLAFLLTPLAVALVVLAEPFILTLYTEKFAASVPIFMVWSLTVVPAIFAVDAVLRVYAQTRFLLVMNLVRLGLVAGLIGWFIGTFGLPGAVLVTLMATVAAKALALLRIARVMHVSLTAVLPWATLARIGARAAAAGVPAWWIADLLARVPWLAFVAGGATYALIYFTLCYAPGVAEPAAIRLPIVRRLQQLWAGFAGFAARNPAHTAESTGVVGRVPRRGPAEAKSSL